MTSVLYKVNNLDIEVVELGKNHPVTIVFAHGMACDLTMWHNQLVYFSKLYHVVAFSLQGHGQSSKPKSKPCYTISEYSKTAILLLDALNIKTCLWVGNSMGGVIGYHVRKLEPERIQQLITNGTTPKLIFNKTVVTGIVLIDKLLLNTIGVKAMLKTLVKQVTPNIEARVRILSSMQSAYKNMIPPTHKALSCYDYLESLQNIKTPIVIIQGENDCDINNSIRSHQNIINTCEHVYQIEFKGVGHIANLENPDAYNSILNRCIKPISSDDALDS